MTPELLVTLWPSFPHFGQFARDPRISGIRLNSAMMDAGPALDKELQIVRDMPAGGASLYFDAKGRQLRIAEVLDNEDYLDVRLNHPIQVPTPTTVLLKAGEDAGMLGDLSEGGFRLTFCQNPRFRVKPGESLHIKDPRLVVGGPLFTDAELEKLAKVKESGLIKRWFLSYVEERADVERFREVIGPDDEVLLKIESKRGLEFVRTWHRKGNERLVAACGDLHVEVDEPHHILDAVSLIAEADPTAIAGSRILLSIAREKMPSYADFAQLAWLYSVGMREFLLCDELCLSPVLLPRAVNAFYAWAGTLRG